MSSEIYQTQYFVVTSIQSQRPNTVIAQALLFSESTANQHFEPQIKSLSILSKETSSTSAASHQFSAVKFPIDKNSRQTKIWVGAPDPNLSAEMDVSLAELSHSNSLPF